MGRRREINKERDRERDMHDIPASVKTLYF